MRFRSGSLAMVLFLLWAGQVAGQTRNVTGKVTDSATNAVVTSGQVSVKGTTFGTTIGSDGTFTIAVPIREVVLVVRSIGFKMREITVPPTQSAVQVSLTPDYFQLEAIIVTGQATAAKMKDLGNATAEIVAGAVAPGFAKRQVAAVPLGRYNRDFNTEEYGHFVENRFLVAESNPLSTFSVDVDRASYSNMRRYINQNQRPPIDAVRIEELVNYFPYDYPEPTGEHPFSITTEVTTAPWSTSHQLMRIGLKARSVELENLPPNNLTFLIDVSGSMNEPTKLPLLQAAFRLLVNEMRPQDRVAMVVYAGAAGVVLQPTSGTSKRQILDAIDRLQAGGSTAGGAGIKLAYQVARDHFLTGGNNRVILATDGDFNVGVSSDGELIRLIEAEREHGIFLTVLGFGMGNTKDSKMEALADHGNGNYAYIDNLLEARKVLVTEMGGTLLTLAKDVKIQVEFNPVRVQAYRLIGYENRMLKTEDFTDDKKDAGELGAGHTVTALYEIVPVGVEDSTIRGADSLRYRTAANWRRAAGSGELAFVKLRYKKPDGDKSILLQQPVRDQVGTPSIDLVFASSVASFGMQLRDSDLKGTWTMGDVLKAARSSLGKDPGGYRREFTELVEKVVSGEMVAKN